MVVLLCLAFQCDNKTQLHVVTEDNESLLKLEYPWHDHMQVTDPADPP